MIQKQKFTFNGKVFPLDGSEFDPNRSPVYYHGTTTCAAGFISAKDYHSIDEINEAIKHIREDSYSKQFSPDERNGGEKLLLITICDFEPNLRKNVIKLGFKKLTNFHRRNGYPKGELELFALNL